MSTPHDDDNTGRAERGITLRKRREALGLPRARLAALSGCGMAQLALIEQGAVPRRSDVLRRAERALAERERTEAEAAR